MVGVKSKLTVRPVGQGAFILGEEVLINDRGKDPTRVRWIYDCGTAGKVETINASIVETHDFWAPSVKIDLLVVSHFDKDHISGLPQLLSDYRFERIVLPFMTRLERVVQSIDAIEGAIEEDLVLAAQLVRLVDDPAAFIIEQGGDGTRVIVARPSDGAPARDSREGEPLGQGEGVLDPSRPLPSSDAAEFSLGSHQLFALQSGERLTWDGLWEFVPYVDPEARKRLLTFDDGTREALEARLRALRTQRPSANASAQEMKDYARELKQQIHSLRDTLYDAMGRSSTGNATSTRKDIDGKDKNCISLMAYMGPTALNYGHTWLLHGEGVDPQLNVTAAGPYAVSARNGVLLTGDADLRDAASVKRLLHYFGRPRIDTLAVAQVPHHGSQYNSATNLPQELNAPIYIFNADPQRKPTKHPDACVVAAFQEFWPAKGARTRAKTILVNDVPLVTEAISSDGQSTAMVPWPHFYQWF